MENKEHNGQEQNEGQDGMPALWYVLFHAKGFTDVCEAFLWCRFTMAQAARRDDAGTGSMPSFEEFSGE
ncbi:hypothetical protein [Dialister succinatiphilus]|uniref:hypothetical protein n=1 Tax=Dialister succinatiphilus TaxID=487173 RepID=UPI00402A1FE9